MFKISLSSVFIFLLWSRQALCADPNAFIITCTSDFDRRCFGSDNRCYRCTYFENGKGVRIDPPKHKLLIMKGHRTGSKERKGRKWPVYTMTGYFKTKNSKYISDYQWKTTFKRWKQLRCVRTKPLGRAFGKCCDACSYREAPKWSRFQALCCRECNYLLWKIWTSGSPFREGNLKILRARYKSMCMLRLLCRWVLRFSF